MESCEKCKKSLLHCNCDIPCVVPGCGVFKRKLLRFHNQAFLRNHLNLLSNFHGELSGDLLVFLKEMLQETLKVFPPDLCVLCFLAEGDTVKCKNCNRFIHEVCDPKFMSKRICSDCLDLLDGENFVAASCSLRSLGAPENDDLNGESLLESDSEVLKFSLLEFYLFAQECGPNENLTDFVGRFFQMIL